ncbi:uncharacterized protein H6S33_006145 [Morchella sextelata]|uniref:uncharacterized protein n=1 Tax=Morchella sextelata TaxID=1174677 RepID=UPI001D05500C|nr:uncharacterized protein H6S33_006145 [Morchella sextelata]KAH0614259.1 hypothetical protein H6S33_006145 [Morchella sextelata]
MNTNHNAHIITHLEHHLSVLAYKIKFCATQSNITLLVLHLDDERNPYSTFMGLQERLLDNFIDYRSYAGLQERLQSGHLSARETSELQAIQREQEQLREEEREIPRWIIRNCEWYIGQREALERYRGVLKSEYMEIQAALEEESRLNA